MAHETATLVRLGDTDLALTSEADDVRGRKVLDKNGNEVGKVDGLIIDQSERRVRFLEVGSGGFLGIGEQRKLVPVDAVTNVDEHSVSVSKDREHVAGGPVYDPELTPTPKRTHFDDVYGYYGVMPHWGAGYVYPGFPFMQGPMNPTDPDDPERRR